MKNHIFLLVAVFIFTSVGIATTGENARANAASVTPQATPEKPLNKEEVGALLEGLKEGLPDLIDDEAAVTRITDKWHARKDLAGKTRTQILNLLFADVKSVINDKATLDSIWQGWRSEEKSDEATPVESPQEPPTPPVKMPEKPAEQNNSTSGSAPMWNDCPPFPSAFARVLRWEALRVPNMLLCRALLTDSGVEAFAITISPESPFKPRRSDRAESARLNGRELFWYRVKLPDQPNVEVREALIPIAENLVVHVYMRANDAQTLSRYQKYVLSLPFPNYVE